MSNELRIRKNITKKSFVVLWLVTSLPISGVLFGLLCIMEGLTGINMGIKEYWICLGVSPVSSLIVPLMIKYKPAWED